MNNMHVLRNHLGTMLRNKNKPGRGIKLMDSMKFLNVQGNPYCLDNHYMFEELFNMIMPRRFLLKCARQVGKCVAVNDLRHIRLSDGSPMTEAKLIPGTDILTHKDGKITLGTISDVWDTGSKKLYEIKTRLGTCIHVSPDHRLLTENGYKMAKDIEKGERLAGIRKAGIFGTVTKPLLQLAIVAYCLGDGALTCSPMLITPSDEVVADLGSLMHEDNYTVKDLPDRNVKRVYFRSKTIEREYLQEAGMIGKYSWEKVLPNWVYDLTQEQTRYFLERLWATDGRACNKTKLEISYTSTSEELALGVRSLLNKLGILCKLSSRIGKYKKDGITHNCRRAYTIRVEGSESWHLFTKLLTIPGRPLKLPFIYSNSNRDTCPTGTRTLCNRVFMSKMHKHATSIRSLKLPRLSNKYMVSRLKLSKYVEAGKTLGLNTKPLEDILESDITWDEITSIELGKAEPTFDIEVKDTHNFVLDGIISHNSLNLAGSEVLKSARIKDFRTLLICPRFEQIKRLSTLYVHPMITTAMIKDMLVDSTCDQSILQRTYKNGSVQYFSFAFLDAERIRSIAADQVVYDEVQDLNWAFMPVIEQTMGGSKDWGMYRYAGTPKSLDNTIEKLWRDSSQDIWSVKCPHTGCKKWNIGCTEMDLLAMIGPRGVICAHCGKKLSAAAIRNGCYLSKFPNRVNSFRGVHVCQPLHPLYFEDSQVDKWLELLKNMHAYPTTRFHNECLGESHDSADRLMTSVNIREQSISEHRNTIDYAKSIRNQYQKLAFGIDWGGGGDDSKSYTVLTVGGFKAGNDTVECIYAVRLSKNFDVLQECAQIQMYWDIFRPDYIAHDFTGAGNVRESMLIGMGIPTDRLVPFTYVYSPTKDVITYNEGGEFAGTRRSYSMDKPRSIVVTCTMLKAGKIKLPNYADCKHLTSDLLNLIEERSPTPRGSDMILIKTVPDESDDFAHALNFMASSLWYTNGAYPELAEAMRMQITIDQLKACNPTEAMFKDTRMWEADNEEGEDKIDTSDIPTFTPKT